MSVPLFALLGLIVGSFLNVVILRHNTGKTLLGRSGCASCRKSLTPYDLVPVLSWLFLKGKCRSCGSAISPQYPLVESVTAVAWGTVGGMGLPLGATVLMTALVTIWIAIVVYDIRHTIIPDAWSYAAAGVACAYGMLLYGLSIETVFYLAISAAVTALPLLLLWWGSGGAALGFGDVKLALSIGLLLGPWLGVIAVLYGFVYGALWAVLVLLPMPHYRALYTTVTGSRLRHVRHRFTMKSEVPFGPFLVLSAVTIWILTALDLHSPLIDAALLSSSFSW